MDAAKDLSVRFHAMPDYAAIAVRTNRRQRVDCALEAIEGVTLPGHDHFKRLVIFILANFTCSHTQSVRAPGALRWCLFNFGSKKLFDHTSCRKR